MIDGWTLDRAIRNNGCTRIPFVYEGNENSRGYSIYEKIALSPECEEPDFVGIHELAHCLLGHSAHTKQEIDKIPLFNRSSIKVERHFDLLGHLHEIEAHAMALLVAKTLHFGPRDFDLNSEIEYLANYMDRAHGHNIDPAQYLDMFTRSRGLDCASKIVLGGFVSPKAGQDILRALA